MTDSEAVVVINRLIDGWNPDSDDDTLHLVREIEWVLDREPKRA